MSIYLDSHVVVWLSAGQVNKLSAIAKTQIDENDLLISPMVLLELKFLHEIGRITPVRKSRHADDRNARRPARRSNRTSRPASAERRHRP